MCKTNEKINTSVEDVELALEEKWKNATIANNFIFYKVMRNNPDVCKELLEILLQIKIDHIEMKTEETVEVDFGKKGIRMDVYAVGANKAFDLEMQATDKGNLPERARYYQGIIDVQELNWGADYKNLKDSYVIFICIPDIFGKGLAKYAFENMCIENPKIKLNDRTYKYFFIANNYDKILDEKQKAFLKLVISNDNSRGQSDGFTERLSKLVEEAKINSQWRKQFMEWEREMAIRFREGERQARIEDARNLFANGVSIEIIAKSLNMTVEEVTEITKSVVPVNA